MMKICTQCKSEKPLNCYYVSIRAKDGHKSECKSCNNLKSKGYCVKNPDKVRAWGKDYSAKNPDKVRVWAKTWRIENSSQIKNYQLQKNYRITLDQYNQMFVQQNGLCAICCIHQSELKQSLGVDHNHTTGVIRGLLCMGCNLGLGSFKDSITSLEKATKYLKDFLD